MATTSAETGWVITAHGEHCESRGLTKDLEYNGFNQGRNFSSVVQL